ncbi:MAG: glucosyltransferase domain-containing protein [Clostridia bacterium]|nr:glucosyltransferase domain-containing protein [Clostridia bacterium]
MEQKENQNPVMTALRKIPPQVRIAFFSAVLFGLFAHGTGLLNKFSHHDDAASLFDLGTTLSSGRWALLVFQWLEGAFFGTPNTSLPLYNGMVSILCIGAVAGLTAHLMKIRNRVFCGLWGCVMVAFPVVTSLFAYMFTSHPYMIGLLMMTAGAYLICAKTPWWAKAIGVGLGGVSVGIYQAYLPVFVTILLLDDIRILSEETEEGTGRRFWTHVGIQILCTAGVMLLYAAGNRFFLNKYQVELSGYQGIDEMGRMTVPMMLERIAAAYRDFFNPSQEQYVFRNMYPGSLRPLYFLMLAADGALALRLIVRTGRRHAGRGALLAILFALLPLGCNMIFVMAENVHGLMVYGQVMQVLLFIWLFDRLDFRAVRLNRAVSGAAACALAAMALMYARYDNQCYLKDTLHQQEAISYFTTVVTRIKSLPGYRPDLEVYFTNADESRDPTLYNIDELDFIRLNPYWHNSREYIHGETREEFVKIWCGADFVWHWGNDLESLPEVQAMPSYPADGSVQIVNDSVVVVKF